MSRNEVHVRELIGWGLDSYEYRPDNVDQPKCKQAAVLLMRRSGFQQSEAFLADETMKLKDSLALYINRPDLFEEMAGLSWSIGIVDLRSLLAFQRRLSFDPAVQEALIPAAGDWASLLDLSFGPPKEIVCDVIHDCSNHTVAFRSDNPNLHFRVTSNAALPVSIHAGGPFLEVARFRGRWFLRDGYHRAYTLLKQGVFEVPAVIVEARTIEELGATQPWFFSEEVLFSATPPYVLDFLSDDLVLEYSRPQLHKILRITMEETLSPALPTGEPS